MAFELLQLFMCALLGLALSIGIDLANGEWFDFTLGTYTRLIVPAVLALGLKRSGFPAVAACTLLSEALMASDLVSGKDFLQHKDRLGVRGPWPHLKYIPATSQGLSEAVSGYI